MHIFRRELIELEEEVNKYLKNESISGVSYEFVRQLYLKHDFIIQDLKILYPSKFKDITIPTTPELDIIAGDKLFVHKDELRKLLIKIKSIIETLG